MYRTIVIGIDSFRPKTEEEVDKVLPTSDRGPDSGGDSRQMPATISPAI
ncbi:MAG: hypothetical protein WCD79_01285 [Chthoniobacteraceae bacterium]